MAFQKGNRRQSVFEPRAIFYKEAAATGIVTLPRHFRPFSPVFATLPPSAPAAASITAVRVLPPASGLAWAAGGRPRVQITLSGGPADVLFTQA